MGGRSKDGERDERSVLTETEQRILALKIGQPKLLHREIAEQLGIQITTVSTLINRDPLRRAIDDHLADLLDQAKEYALASVHKAFGVLIELMENAVSENVKRLSARDLILILAKRGDPDAIGDEEWEATIGQYGTIKTERVKKLAEEAETSDGERE